MLERNYRSTQPILAAANAVIDLASERFTKNLWSDRASAERPHLVNVVDDTAQAGYIVERTLENREAGITLKSQAVLFRASHHSASLEVELTRRNIPFVKFGGLKFLEAAHIKDVLAVLRWGQNIRDRVAGFRVAQVGQRVGFARACARDNEKRRSFTKPVAAMFHSAALFGVELAKIGCGHTQPPRPRKARPSLFKGLSPRLISRVAPTRQ